MVQNVISPLSQGWLVVYRDRAEERVTEPNTFIYKFTLKLNQTISGLDTINSVVTDLGHGSK